MKGRPPKPPGQAVGHSPRTPLSVVPPAQLTPKVPEPPAGLERRSIELWEAFWRSPVALAVIDADRGALERWIRVTDEIERVGRVFRRNRLVDGSQGQPALNPLARYLAQLEESASRLEERFGMTPAARARLGLVVGKAKLTAQALNDAVDATGGDDEGWDGAPDGSTPETDPGQEWEPA